MTRMASRTALVLAGLLVLALSLLLLRYAVDSAAALFPIAVIGLAGGVVAIALGLRRAVRPPAQ
jgi:hypothetical protein